MRMITKAEHRPSGAEQHVVHVWARDSSTLKAEQRAPSFRCTKRIQLSTAPSPHGFLLCFRKMFSYMSMMICLTLLWGLAKNKFPKGHLGPLGLSAEPAKLGSAETKPCGRHRPIAMQDFCTGQPRLLELFVNRLIAGCARARPCVGSLRLVCLRWEMPIEGSLRSFRDLCKGMRGFRCQNPRASVAPT